MKDANLKSFPITMQSVAAEENKHYHR